ncbi:hypothetical protein [Planococcus sp. NCCP-2050]|uniref:hypothetical protein n=1 Tax=Planococcus sp. NCCP-2050 TaxID=2944679 RepID=UPI00203C435F|nr:hypothetical protein [Planococcus sp. NCCP-2050]GKW45868.1 hypothetical protein NCCP2050_15600 [Planococcus sp. NCCP-2050]
MIFNFKEEIFENINILATLQSPSDPYLGILITGEEYFLDSKQPIIKVYLINKSNSEWRIQKELETFVFSSYASAKKFVMDLPEMSALDLLLVMNGWQANELFIQ